MNDLKMRNSLSCHLWQMRKATFPFIMYTGIKTSQSEHHLHIKNSPIAFMRHRFLAYLLCSGHSLNPEDTMKTRQALLRAYVNTSGWLLVKYHSAYSKDELQILKHIPSDTVR